jgi:hypothetical protein
MKHVGRGTVVALRHPLCSDVETTRLVLWGWLRPAVVVSGFHAQVVSRPMGKPHVPWRIRNGHPRSSGSLQ